MKSNFKQTKNLDRDLQTLRIPLNMQSIQRMFTILVELHVNIYPYVYYIVKTQGNRR